MTRDVARILGLVGLKPAVYIREAPNSETPTASRWRGEGRGLAPSPVD